VIPTRNGRNGMLFTKEGIINIKNNKWKDDFSPLEKDGEVFADTLYSKGYLRHLVIAKEILGAQIATIHNLGFYMWLLRSAREHILKDTFVSWKKEMIEKLNTRL
jgi:queuine tRNA-ribosyltransferase